MQFETQAHLTLPSNGTHVTSRRTVSVIDHFASDGNEHVKSPVGIDVGRRNEMWNFVPVAAPAKTRV